MALRAIDASTANPAGLHIVIIEQVESEYQKHASNEKQNLSKHFRTLSHTGVALLQKPLAASWQAGLSAIQTALSALPDNLLYVSHKVSHDASCAARAQLRLANSIAPGRRGSGNVADCMIAEHLLEVSRELRGGGFAKRFVFASSNIKDFGPTGQPKPPLDREFRNLGIEYLPDIEAAMAGLGF